MGYRAPCAFSAVGTVTAAPAGRRIGPGHICTVLA
jgi:hypothetical protein